MLHASKTWPLTKPNLQHLQQNNRAMIRQICNVRPQDIVTTRSNELLVGLGIEDLDLILKREDSDGMDMWNTPMVLSRQPLTYRLMESVGLGGPRWHGNSWQRGIAEWKLSAINLHDRHTWRSGVRSAMPVASQLSGRGPIGVDLPLYLHVNQKSNCDDDTTCFCSEFRKKSVIFSWKVCLIWSYVTALFRVLKDFSTNLTSP